MSDDPKFKRPVRISDLSQSTLASIVSDIYEIVFWSGNGYDPDKELGATENGEIANVFFRERLGPIPTEES